MKGQQLPAAVDTSTLFLDQLAFLSPRTWWGFLQVQSKSPFVAFNLEIFGREILGLVAPLLIFLILHGAFSANKSASRDMLSERSAQFLAVILSPWALSLSWIVLQELLLLWKTLKFYRTSRASVLASATWALEDRIQRNRAYRTRRYDVYLPPDLLPSGDTTMQRRLQQQPALLLIPGALVPHEAYAEPAGRLSDDGFLVAVVSMEPLRLAYHHLGADLVSMKRIMRTIQRDEEKRRQTKSGASQQQQQQPPPPTTAGGMQWTLMGHSMGSFAVMKLFRDVTLRGSKRNTSKIANSVTISNRLILWALAPFVDMATDLSTLEDTRILIVQASEDHISQQLASGKAQLEACFPSNRGKSTTSTTEMHVLGGATHDGFGSYWFPVKESQNSDMDEDTLRDVVANKTAAVQTNVPTSLPEQQQEACALTSRFCSENLSPSHFIK